MVLDHPLLAVLEPDERRSIDKRLLRRRLAPGEVCVEEGAITTESQLGEVTERADG